MHHHTGPLRSLAATARLANLPSVACNVWLGILPAILTHGAPPDIAMRSGAATLSAICLYLFGGFLNDWADRSWDAAHRPERALPRGLFSASAYLAVAIAFAAAGILSAMRAGPQALAFAFTIAACIALYTKLHKKSAWSVVPMGLCRALLPLLGWAAFSSTFSPLVIAAALALWFHVAGISIMARRESKLETQPSTPGLHHGFFVIPVLLAFAGSKYGFELPWSACLIGLLPYSLWTTFCMVSRINLPARVSGLLASIPWLDGMLLFPVHLAAGGLHADSPFIAACLWLPLLAFVAGRALQRYAPAT